MIVAGFSRLFASVAVLTLAAGFAAATPLKDGGATAAASEPAEHAAYDRTADETVVALRDTLVDGVADDLIARNDAEAIVDFYRDRGFTLAWIEDGKLTDGARAIVERIKRADADGLDPTAYRLPWQSLGLYVEAGATEQAEADLMLSQAIADYARHLYSGRVDPAKLSSNLGYQIRPLDPGDILGLVSASAAPVATLDAYQPPQKEYQALRAELARERTAKKAETKPDIPGGALIKPGMSDPRVLMIRERLELSADAEDPAVYDEAVVEAVKDFQRSARLRPDGIVGKNTLAAFNRGPVDNIAAIILNMERWRWMPRYLGDFYVRVNVPNYNLDIYRNDKVVHTTPIVVGKVGYQTPIFSDEIEHVVVNPVWNVPASIARNEMLPKLRAGSGLGGYNVYANVRGKFRAVNPRSINWRTVNMSKIQIKQPPGARNALGQVKFLFPNKYAVYLHDTPSKSLFERETRAFSHGCMRVKNPWDFAEALLAYSPEADAAKLRKMVGGGERWVNLDKKIPVHVTYFTAWMDDNGKLQVRDDIYGHDKRLAEALGSG